MNFKENIPSVWDKVWGDEKSLLEDSYYLEKEKHSIRWRRIRKRVLHKFGSFKGLKTIEIGGGQGLYSLLFALEGADVTILDYSPKAIKLSKKLFKRNNLKATFIQEDALHLKEKFDSQFDISMSFGTAEHFKGKNRIEFIKIHLRVLKQGGITFIAVPNKANLLYLFWRFLSTSFGRWKFGEEFPFNRKEFRKIGKQIHQDFDFMGGYLFDSNFVIIKRIKKLFNLNTFSLSKIKFQIGTPIDKYFSRILIATSKE